MSKVLVVFGATGQQGGSVIDYVLNDPELSQTHKIRAITRDVNSEKSVQLKQKVEVLQCDVLDRDSLENALTGAHTIFIVTTPFDGFDAEYNDGKTISDVAVERGASYLIFSTLPPVSEISGGKYTKVTPFDAKAEIEKYIRSLPIRSAFFSPGGFMQNFHSFMAPQPTGDGTWEITRHTSPTSRVPLIDAVGDTGKFIGAILAEPDKYEGKTFCAATAFYSLEETVAAMSKATGKNVVYRRVPVEQFRQSLPFMADVMVEGLSFQEDFGYYGPDSKELVAWAVENARGKLTSLEEYLEANPLKL